MAAAKWIGTATGVTGVVLIPLNLSVVAYGFGLSVISSLLWTAVGWVQREPSLMLLQTAFTVINMLGAYLWMLL